MSALVPGPVSASAPAPVGQGESLMHNVLPDVMVYLSAISAALSSAGIPISVGLPSSAAAFSLGSTSCSSHAANAPVSNVAAPVSHSLLGSTVRSPDLCSPRETARLSVSEVSMKEVLPCEMSPLGYHLPGSVKEKIWAGDFVDMLSLLSASKDFIFKMEKKGEDRQEENRRRPIARLFNNWLQTFFVFSSVLVEKQPELSGGLFQHMDHVLEADKSFYDESFRQKLVVHPSLRWGMKDVGLWLNLIVPQRLTIGKLGQANPVNAGYCRGCCFAFNESSCRFNATCKYGHECSVCAGPHLMVKCFRKTAPQSSRDIFPKSLHASEAGKHAPPGWTCTQTERRHFY